MSESKSFFRDYKMALWGLGFGVVYVLFCWFEIYRDEMYVFVIIYLTAIGVGASTNLFMLIGVLDFCPRTFHFINGYICSFALVILIINIAT